MDKNEIFKQIQELKSSNPVIVLGSGASADYGIPGMDTLSERLEEFFKQNPCRGPKSEESISTFLKELENGEGLETALQKARLIDEVEGDIIKKVWQLISEADRTVYERVTKGERINLTNLFDYLIYGAPSKVVNVISTNYDKIAEYAACQTKAYINIGFTNGLIGKVKGHIISSPKNLEEDYIGIINILKVHGSLDWFERDGNIENFANISEIPDGSKPCIVTPGVKKYERTQQEPFRQILSATDQIFESASGYLCIGYGFNDNHIHPMLLKNSSKKKAKIMIATKEITKAIQKNVIDKGYDYIAVYSDGADGTIFKTSNGELAIEDEKYWTIEGLLEI